jgi:multicomponent Na+:H+ antiporter subunit C
MTILMAATAAALFSIGTYLVLQRKLSRIIIGLGLLTHGGNLLLITSGRRGNPPIFGSGDPSSSFSDPLPQALALTAIVITFAVTILLLALAYRSWLLTSDDEVEDDVGDRDAARARTLHEEIDDQARAMTDGIGDPEP